MRNALQIGAVPVLIVWVRLLVWIVQDRRRP